MSEYKVGKDFEVELHKLDIKKKKKSTVANHIDIGYYLVTPMLIGVIVGLYLDSRFKSKPLYTMIFLFLGVVGMFYNLWKVTKE